MRIRKLLELAVLALPFLAGGAFAADKAAQQAEVLKKTHATLERFYKAKPELKGKVAAAPGYGVFTTYGFSFILGGEGGAGVVHENKAKKNTFMKVGGASAGLQLGAAQTEMLMIFKTAEQMHKFIESGWEAGGSATASAGASGATAGGGREATTKDDAETYTLTKNGLEGGLALGGAKFWKDKDLN